MGRAWQPYESHLPYLLKVHAELAALLHPLEQRAGRAPSLSCAAASLLRLLPDLLLSHPPSAPQLKVDFNLYGMGWLRLGQARFR